MSLHCKVVPRLERTDFTQQLMIHAPSICDLANYLGFVATVICEVNDRILLEIMDTSGSTLCWLDNFI